MIEQTNCEKIGRTIDGEEKRVFEMVIGNEERTLAHLQSILSRLCDMHERNGGTIPSTNPVCSDKVAGGNVNTIDDLQSRVWDIIQVIDSSFSELERVL